MEFGRMLIASDPTGGVFGVWQAKQHSGFQLANETGADTWNELLTRDPEAAREFYAAVFGYTYSPFGDDYSMFEVDGTTAGGIGAVPAAAPAEVPAHWRTYFAVADADAAAAKVVELGGSIVRPPEDMPYGRHADVQDPQGAYFAIIKPASPE
jgi:predicted enzyme related to lactoylglutathione lyase